MSYTPGPWHQVGAWVEHPDDDVADICSCHPDDFGQGHFGRSYEEMHANARLIAAAPELLEALEDCRDVLEDYAHIVPFLQARERAEAAIAKAKGE